MIKFHAKPVILRIFQNIKNKTSQDKNHTKVFGD